MPPANKNLSTKTPGIKPIHWAAVIGTVHIHNAPPTACAVNVAPKLLDIRFWEYFCGNSLATIGIVQNKVKNHTSLPTGCKTKAAIATSGTKMFKFLFLEPK